MIPATIRCMSLSADEMRMMCLSRVESLTLGLPSEVLHLGGAGLHLTVDLRCKDAGKAIYDPSVSYLGRGEWRSAHSEFTTSSSDQVRVLRERTMYFLSALRFQSSYRKKV